MLESHLRGRRKKSQVMGGVKDLRGRGEGEGKTGTLSGIGSWKQDNSKQLAASHPQKSSLRAQGSEVK